VWVFDPKGGRLGVIPTPEAPAACTLGDPDGKTLYITARSRVYRIRMTVGSR
jgi:gluconolactonase